MEEKSFSSAMVVVGTILAIVGALVMIALGLLALVACGKNKGDTVDIPYVNDFTCDYYDENGNVINDKSKVFKYGDEIRVKIGFTLSKKAYAAGKRDLTLKFAPPIGFDGKFLSANSSTTSSKSFTALYTVDDKKDKKCEVELQIDVYYSAGSLKICYAYDDEEYTEAGRFSLKNGNTLLYDYDAATDGFIVSRDLWDSEWLKNVKEISIPDSFADKPITGIGQKFFDNCIYIRRIYNTTSTVTLAI